MPSFESYGHHHIWGGIVHDPGYGDKLSPSPAGKRGGLYEI